MSRKFLDDNIQVKAKVDRLPGFSTTSAISKNYEPGHRFQDEVTGKLYENVGDRQGGNLFVHKMVNRTILRELFLKRPGLAADLDPGTVDQTALRLYTVANKDWILVGTNAATAGSVLADGGGVTITSTSTSGDQMIVTPLTTINSVAGSSFGKAKWNTLDRVIFEANIKTAASIASIVIWAGLKLTNTSVTATDNDQAFFRFAPGTNSGKWQAISSNTDVDSTYDSGVTVAASTAYHLMIKVDANRVPRFFINGVQIAVGAALASDIDLIPFIGVQTAAAATKAITLRAVELQKDLND